MSNFEVTDKGILYVALSKLELDPVGLVDFKSIAEPLTKILNQMGYTITKFVLVDVPPAKNWKELSDIAIYGQDSDSLE